MTMPIIKILSKTTARGIENALDYIMDEEKCVQSVEMNKIDDDPILEQFHLDDDEDLERENGNSYIEKNINNVIHYMANEKKIKKKFISGYMCHPETAEEEFLQTMQTHMDNKGKTLDDLDGSLSYHIVQSFPEELDISDEEVHQMGIELLQKLEKYQGVVSSHLHPELKEDGLIHGKCKHNHILINAYIEPRFIDPKHPNKIKYNDSKETYRQLQIWSDEIALKHGIPIINTPNFDKAYSWYETEAINKGRSWKERVRIDIDNMKRISNSWDEYLKNMEQLGYQIRDKKYVSYTTPDGQKIRDTRLGNEYERKEIISYFDLKYRLLNELEDDETVNDKDNSNDKINHFIDNYGVSNLFISIQRNKSGKYAETNNLQNDTYQILLPLEKNIRSESYNSYFIANQVYDICTKDNTVVGTITGQQAAVYYKKLEEHKEENIRRQQMELEEFNDENFRIDTKKQVFYNVTWITYQKKKPKTTNLYDAYGRRRSSLELLLMLAFSYINTDAIYWLDPKVNYNTQATFKGPLYARRDWKKQNIIDTIGAVKKRNINTKSELNTRLKQTGTSISTLKRQEKALKTNLNKMDVIYNAIKDYKDLKALCESFLDMPPSMEKEKLQREHKEDIDKFKAASATLYRTKTMDSIAMSDFLERYESIQTKHKQIEKELKKAKEEYRTLKKIEYNIQLAQNTQYVCGLNYEEEKVMNDDLDNPEELTEDQIEEQIESKQARR